MLKQILRSYRILDLPLYNDSYIPFRLLKENLSLYGQGKLFVTDILYILFFQVCLFYFCL